MVSMRTQRNVALAIIVIAILCAKCTGSEWSAQHTAHCANSLELRDKNCDFYGPSSAFCKGAQEVHLSRCSLSKRIQAVLKSSDVEDHHSSPKGLPMSRSDGNQRCGGRWGYIDPNMSNMSKMSNITKKEWQEGQWSKITPVGFAGNSLRTEQYQIAPPGCPVNCNSKSTSQTSFEALKDSSCAATQTGLGHVTVSAGTYHTCATTQAFALACWGRDNDNQADNGVVMLRKEGITDFSSVSAGLRHTCGVIKETELVRCWGFDRFKQTTVPAQYNSTKFTSVSAGEFHTCGLIKETELVRCWGYDTQKQATVPAEFKNTKFNSVSAGLRHTCGLIKEAEQLVCWGYDKYNQATVPAEYNNTEFISVSAGSKHTCGLTKEAELVRCWGSDQHKQTTVPDQFNNTKFTSVSAGFYHTCGLTKEAELVRCWGSDQRKQVTVPAQYKNTKFTSVSAGGFFTCGVTKEAEQVVCWGQDGDKQLRVPKKTVKWIEETSCLTSHSVISGPASCTSCDPDACNKHFTIIDPKTNTGTCTKTECPFCKPKECCTAGHKHFVLNTENLEGVCVRHNDDCTPVCVPYGSNDPGVKRVCSKGCNRLLKIVRNQSAIKSEHLEMSRHHKAKTEGDLFDLVVCQADKRVVCDPTKQRSKCMLEAEITAQAVCRFSPELWNLGATCIKNHVHRDTHPQCADGASHKMIDRINGGTQTRQWTTTHGLCRKATLVDSKFCQTLAIVY